MKKILATMAAAVVLIAGVATAAVISSSSASAQETTDDTDTTTVDRPERGSVLKDVLDELVTSNDISQQQADKIISALEDKWAELEANRPDGFGAGLRGFHRGFRGHPGLGPDIAQLLEDGVIDQQELASLPEGSILTDPNGPFADVASDNEITAEEFQSVVDQMRQDMEGHHHGFFGPDVSGDDAPAVEGSSV